MYFNFHIDLFRGQCLKAYSQNIWLAHLLNLPRNCSLKSATFNSNTLLGTSSIVRATDNALFITRMNKKKLCHSVNSLQISRLKVLLEFHVNYLKYFIKFLNKTLQHHFILKYSITLWIPGTGPCFKLYAFILKMLYVVLMFFLSFTTAYEFGA